MEKPAKRCRKVLQCGVCGRYVSETHWVRHFTRNLETHRASQMAELKKGEQPSQGYYWWQQRKSPNDIRASPVVLNLKWKMILDLVK